MDDVLREMMDCGHDVIYLSLSLGFANCDTDTDSTDPRLHVLLTFLSLLRP